MYSEDNELRNRTRADNSPGMLPNRRQTVSNSRLFLYIAGVVLVLYLLVSYRNLFFSQPYQYVIMIDAGSTGSRVHVFKLQKSGESINVLENYFDHLEPGLSFYHKEPNKAAESLSPLLKFAVRHIPNDQLPHTKIEVKATAGLRLLSESIADNILNEVTNFIKSQKKFYTPTNHKLAAIMEGEDEGLFAWISLNYYLGNIDSKDPINVAAIDLGGGSFQVVSELNNLHSIQTNSLEKHMHKVSLSGIKRNIFVKSFLGMGLKAARFALLRSTDAAKTLTSPCLPRDYEGEWEYNTGVKYSLRGSPISDFESCLESMRSQFNTQIIPITELSSKDVYIFSYFYDRAVDAGLVRGYSTSKLYVSDYREAAKHACSAQLLNMRFQCLDLTFISYILEDGFKFAPSFQIYVAKKIDNKEISWALGAAFHLASKDF